VHSFVDGNGRGNLSQRTLVDWIGYVLSLCQDQVVVTDRTLERGEFKSRTGLGERTASTLLNALRFYFPALWPEAETDDGDARPAG
jgi:hypothetical protein